MEIKIRLPSGGYVEFKREPMDRERFMTICILIGIFISGFGVLKFFALMV